MEKKFTVRNVLLTLTFLGMLLFPMVAVTRAAATTMQVQPASTSVQKGSTFTINITINDVNGLYGWEFKLYYKNNVLNGTSLNFGPFLGTGGNTFPVTKQFTDNYNATHGIVWLAESLLGAPSGINGSGTIASITFNATAIGGSPLSLAGTKIADRFANPIAHSDVNGYVSTYEVKVYHITVPLGTFNVTTTSNATTSGMQFSHEGNMINFTFSGPANTTGYCNVTIPKTLIWTGVGETWNVKLNGTAVTPIVSENATHTFIHFAANFSSSYIVEVIGTGSVIPEFPTTIVTIAMMLALTVVIVATSKFLKKRKPDQTAQQINF